jgi:hypothetical protein
MTVLKRFAINITSFINDFGYLLLFASILMIVVMMIKAAFCVAITIINMGKALHIIDICMNYFISDWSAERQHLNYRF